MRWQKIRGNSHRMFFKTDYVLGYKASTDKYKKTEITSCILSDRNEIKNIQTHRD
jgi:hypothetical protein